MSQKITVLTKRVESKICVLRGRKVILDSDLAELYGVQVKRLNQQVKRNAKRFPADFVFRVATNDLRLQFATSNETTAKDARKRATRGGRRYYPYAFTEHGAMMAATVLNTKKAVEMTIYVVRAFVRMREALVTNQKITAKLKDLERRANGHDADIEGIVEAIRELIKPLPPTGRRIGFEVPAANV